jgi:transcriptional regulator with XRE-family HTH domain
MPGNRKPSPEICARLATNVKSLREARNYTQQELMNLSLANLEALAQGLGCLEIDLLMPIRKLPELSGSTSPRIARRALESGRDWPAT